MRAACEISFEAGFSLKSVDNSPRRCYKKVTIVLLANAVSLGGCEQFDMLSVVNGNLGTGRRAQLLGGDLTQ